jgi:hypothetical protein
MQAMERATNIRFRDFSYGQFRVAAGLSKKEADGWVQAGVIAVEPANGHRRRYGLEAIVEGRIAKQVADFSSRELLPKTMAALRDFLHQEKISLTRISPNPSEPHQLLKIYTRRSAEIVPGGGVRGVVGYVSRYEPSTEAIGKAVFLVIDLTLIVLETLTVIGHLEE